MECALHFCKTNIGQPLPPSSPPRLFFAPTALHPMTMSKLFRRPSSKVVPAPDPDLDPNSAYSSLLNPVSSHQHLPQHRRTKSSPSGLRRSPDSRPWLLSAAVGSRTSGDRPPARKLVKEPGGSSRPSFSLELPDDDAEKEKGFLGRGIDRLKGLYRRER